MSKEKEGLEVKHCSRFDIALFLFKILCGLIFYFSGTVIRRFQWRSLIWWTMVKSIITMGDICSVGDPLEENQEPWFSSTISYQLGDESNIDFWRHFWIWSKPLYELFLSLFMRLGDDGVQISDMGQWCEGSWSWNLKLLMQSDARDNVTNLATFQVLL